MEKWKVFYFVALLVVIFTVGAFVLLPIFTTAIQGMLNLPIF